MRAVTGSLVALGASVVLLAAGCGESGPTYANPVFEPILADPGAVRGADGAWYAIGTEDDWGDGAGSRPLPVLRSDDLVEWEHLGEAFERRPRWKDGYLWAPEVIEHDGRYLLYYAISLWGDPDPGIGVATADEPAGPYEDLGPLFLSSEIGVGNSIDPAIVTTEDGLHLVWGSFHGIYLVELSDDGLEVRSDPVRIAGDAWEAVKIEQRDGAFWFFGSLGSCCEGMQSTYRMAVGRADALTGPYLDRDGEDLEHSHGTLLLEGGEDFVGPGHHDLVTDDDGQDWLLYHAYERDRPTAPSGAPRRVLMLDPLDWDDDGWPQVRGGTVPQTGERPMPAVDDQD
ncbi:family 43 glycosylhydrolase [Egicoccus sp. AB-alg6-2]|uniref:family 43 glycosylhydrolase n=1 Tax=Egicoccus sp. AB-alg6-2 TaxID=3242692 RepID=UPI00359D200A